MSQFEISLNFFILSIAKIIKNERTQLLAKTNNIAHVNGILRENGASLLNRTIGKPKTYFNVISKNSPISALVFGSGASLNVKKNKAPIIKKSKIVKQVVMSTNFLIILFFIL
jgi:hypothetical protein